MPSEAMAPDRVWSTLPTRRLRQFGAALDARTDGRIPHVPLITERPRRLRSSPPCQACGNSGPFFCECEGDEL